MIKISEKITDRVKDAFGNLRMVVIGAKEKEITKVAASLNMSWNGSSMGVRGLN